MLKLENLKPQGKNTRVTISQALKEQSNLVEECKVLGNKASHEMTSKSWNDLVKAQKRLLDITEALLKINADGNNNRVIKEREMLTRQLEVLDKAQKYAQVKETKMAPERFADWLKGKRRINSQVLKNYLLVRIDLLTEELTKFNNQEIEINI